MEFKVTLERGPLNFEISGEDREEVQQELIGLIEFVHENSETFDGIRREGEAGEEGETPDVDSEYWEEKAEEREKTEEEEALEPISRKVDIPAEELAEFLYADPEGESDPEILIDDPDKVFGTARTVKQRPASLILLYLWSECYDDKEEVSSSELKDALSGSGIDPSYLYNIYDRHIDQSGPNNETLSISRSGELKAREIIEDLVKSEQ